MKRESKMCNVTIQAGMGHLVRLMLFNREMEKGLKFSPKYKQLQIRAKALKTYLKAKLLFTSYFHLYFLLYIYLFIFKIFHIKETKQNSWHWQTNLTFHNYRTHHQAAASVTKKVKQKPQGII